jgi:hypothetical protein
VVLARRGFAAAAGAARHPARRPTRLPPPRTAWAGLWRRRHAAPYATGQLSTCAYW